MTKITVSADRFRRALSCISSEETRFYLQGVFVTPAKDNGGILLVSTDGHRLIIIRDPDGTIEGEPVIVSPNAALVKALKAKKQKYFGEKYFVLDGNEAAVTTERYVQDSKDAILDTDAEHAEAYQKGNIVIDGSFPDYSRVVPKIDPALPHLAQAYNGEYFGAFSDALNVAGDIRFVIAFADGEHNPALVKGSDINALGVLMPVRKGSASNPITADAPSWY